MNSRKPAQRLLIGDFITAVGTAVADVYPCTLPDGSIVSIEDDTTAPTVGEFAFYYGNTPANRPPAVPTWERLTDAEYAKWMVG